MYVKIDTKEKFTVITAEEAKITANMTEELGKLLLEYLDTGNPHLVFNAQNIAEIEDEAAMKLATIQQRFYENNASFVICSMQPAMVASFDKLEISDIINSTPTESEAWDILQMEAIERELLGDLENDSEQ